MAQTEFNTTATPKLVRTAWAKKAWLWAQENMFFTPFTGMQYSENDARTGGDGKKGVDISNGSNSLITRKEELRKEKGETIDIRLLAPLYGNGQKDDDILEGNEEKLSYFTFSPTVHQRRHAVAVAGMNEKRTMVDVREDAKIALGQWMAQMIDTDTVLALSGLPNAVGTLAANAPSTNRYFAGGQTAAGVLTNASGTLASISTSTDDNHLFGTQVISLVKRKAMLGSSGYPKIRPISYKGKNYYVMFIHPWQAKALKGETAWLSYQQNAANRGMDNPLFSGALGEFDGVIIHEWEKIETRLGDGSTTANGTASFGVTAIGSGVTAARALFCGAQAGVHAVAKNISWDEQVRDYGNVWGVACSIIMSAMKTEFNSEDFGCIAVDTCVIPD